MNNGRHSPRHGGIIGVNRETRIAARRRGEFEAVKLRPEHNGTEIFVGQGGGGEAQISTNGRGLSRSAQPQQRQRDNR